MKVHNIEQCSDDWFKVRALKMTASNAQSIGNCGKGLETYIYKILSEYYSSAERENYTNSDIDRGNELEEVARAMYELKTSNKVDQVGFIELDEFIGGSPDGLVGEDGGIEIKCQNDLRHFKTLVNGEIDSKHIWQIQMCLLITERKWWDFISYNPNFEKSLYIHRIYPDSEKHEKLKKGFEIGKKLINKLNN